MKRLKELVKKVKKGELLIVDEPCAGYIVSESLMILKILKGLVKRGISVIVIEHAKEIIKNADYIIEFGPEAGKYGGEIVFEGSLSKFKKTDSRTSKIVFSDLIKDSGKGKLSKERKITIEKINKHNLKNFDVTFPINSLDCLCGKSGSGKTTLLQLIYSSLYKGKNAWKIREKTKVYKSLKGKENVRRTYFVEQTSIVNNSNSTLATYLKIGQNIRQLYADLPKSKKLGLSKSDFITSKLQSKVLSIKYKKFNIKEVLNLTVDEALNIFTSEALIKRKLLFLQTVGLGYLVLGQQAGSLSGGEAQRIRLAKVLTKKLGDRCVYLLDVPTRGLHLSDLPVLLKVFKMIIDKNNTIVIADNKMELIGNSDCVIKL